ncbi:hypothetical protein ACXYTP_23530 [Tsukamurella ocularis]
MSPLDEERLMSPRELAEAKVFGRHSEEWIRAQCRDGMFKDHCRWDGRRYWMDIHDVRAAKNAMRRSVPVAVTRSGLTPRSAARHQKTRGNR